MVMALSRIVITSARLPVQALPRLTGPQRSLIRGKLGLSSRRRYPLEEFLRVQRPEIDSLEPASFEERVRFPLVANTRQWNSHGPRVNLCVQAVTNNQF